MRGNIGTGSNGIGGKWLGNTVGKLGWCRMNRMKYEKDRIQTNSLKNMIIYTSIY